MPGPQGSDHREILFGGWFVGLDHVAWTTQTFEFLEIEAHILNQTANGQRESSKLHK